MPRTVHHTMEFSNHMGVSNPADTRPLSWTFQGGAGAEPEGPEPSEPFFQEPKLEPEPYLLAETVLKL